MFANTTLLPGVKRFNVMRTLLNQGADPNSVYEGRSLWQYFIHQSHAAASYVRYPDQHKQETRLAYLADIFRIFLESGADPRVHCIRHDERLHHSVGGIWFMDYWMHGRPLAVSQTSLEESLGTTTGQSGNELAFEEEHALTIVIKDIFVLPVAEELVELIDKMRSTTASEDVRQPSMRRRKKKKGKKSKE